MLFRLRFFNFEYLHANSSNDCKLQLSAKTHHQPSYNSFFKGNYTKLNHKKRVQRQKLVKTCTSVRPKKGASQVILLQVSWCKLHGTIVHNNIKGRKTCQRQNLSGKCALLSVNYIKKIKCDHFHIFSFLIWTLSSHKFAVFFFQTGFSLHNNKAALHVCQVFLIHHKKTSQDKFLYSE